MYLDNITVPVVFINALDDPIIPEPLLKWPKNYTGKNELFINETQFLTIF